MTHGIVVCDKPAGLSSHGMVALLRKAFRTRAVGHAGTLDPMATGVLVVAIGEGLKVLRYLCLDDKAYEATVLLGSETDTLDADGKVLRSAAVPEGLTVERVQEVCRRFEGQFLQRAPIVSALKQGGVALHKRVRRGEAIEAPERMVTVGKIAVRAVRGAEIDLHVDCGKGFYVRALARDLAIALDTVGHLCKLRRTQSGTFSIEGSVASELVRSAATDLDASAALRARVIPVAGALNALTLTLDDAGIAHARQGRPIALSHVCGDHTLNGESPIEPILLCNATGLPVALARCASGVLQVVRGLHL